MSFLVRLVVGLCLLFGLAQLSETMMQMYRLQFQSSSSKDVLNVGGNVYQAATAVLLSRPDVQVELNFDDSQRETLEQRLFEMQLSASLAIATLRSESHFSSQSDPEFAAYEECERAIVKASRQSFERQFAQVINAAQIVRLHQLQFQTEGLAAFQRHDVRERLNLSKVQEQEIHELPAGIFARFASASELAIRQRTLRAILTSEQWETWQELQGEEFPFADYRDSTSLLVPGSDLPARSVR